MDPLQAAHRYSTDRDRELAAIIASCLAYGKAALFLPVLNALLDIADRNGGPRIWIETFGAEQAEEIAHIRYRWNRAPDFALLALTLQKAIREHGTVGALFALGHHSSDKDLGPCLERSILALRNHSMKAAEESGLPAESFRQLPRGFRTFLSIPSEGSACKRWNLLLRWMCREEFPDLGQWKLPMAKLRIPLDKHVHDISSMVGLTRRKQADGKTVDEITSKLREIDPEDPIRFDFALSHLGMSGDCRKKYIPDICQACPLYLLCLEAKKKEKT
jgi:uncharacterized protein (TIGR02757 family)